MSTPPPNNQYCPSCHKALPSGAAFCPACGYSASKTKTGTKPWIIASIIAGLFAVGASFSFLNQQSTKAGGGLFAALSPTPTPTPLPEDSTPILRTTLDEFGKSYDENKIFAKTNYEGKFIAIQGRIESIDGEAGSGILRLRGSTTAAAIYCRFNSRTTPQIAKVRTGTVVFVRGFFMGGEEQRFGTDRLDLTDCKLEE